MYGSSFDGIVTAFFVAAAVIGALATVALLYGLPWLWSLIKPWLHQITG